MCPEHVSMPMKLKYYFLFLALPFLAAKCGEGDIVENLDENAVGFPIVTETRTGCPIDVAMSNSFGFGGTNCSLVFENWKTD